MSIIQEALKKAQGDFIEKEVPQEKSDAVAIEGADIEPTRPVIRAYQRREDKKAPSVRLPALVSILAILLLIYGFRASLQYSRKPDGALNMPAVAKSVAGPVETKKSDAGSSGMFGQSIKLNPADFMAPRQNLLVLNGIMYVESRPQAIINGKVLEEGDKINGATVLVIEKDCVLVEYNDTNVRLDLNKQN